MSPVLAAIGITLVAVALIALVAVVVDDFLHRDRKEKR